jgi:hypothetical protein
MRKNMKYPVIKTSNSNHHNIFYLVGFLFCFILLAGCGGEIETGSLNGGGSGGSGGGGVGGTKSVSLSWEAPTTNDEIPETCLTDLGSYRLYYNDTGGVSKTTYVNYYTVSISQGLCVDTGVDAGTGCGNIRTCTYTADGLTAGTWYFVVTARDFSGNESIESNMVPKDVI